MGGFFGVASKEDCVFEQVERSVQREKLIEQMKKILQTEQREIHEQI